MKGSYSILQGKINKYSDMENIMNIVDRESESSGGWDREWKTKKLVFCIG